MRLWLLLTVAVCLMPRIAQAACTTPAGVEGQILYNQDYKLVQYCDGINWVKLGGSTTDSRIGSLTANKWCAANAGGTGFDCTQNAPAATAGTNTQVIINDGGALAGAANLLWLKTLNSNAGGLRLGSASAPTVTLDVTGNEAISGNSTIGGTLGVTADLAVNTNKFIVTAASGNTAIAGKLAVGATSAATSALVDLTSTSLGLLPPRMTSTQRDAISTPATGLMVYNTTSGQYEFYNGSAWTGIGSTTTGQISAFAATTCPSGWTEYTASRGRFLRGYDNGAGNDPDDNRAIGNIQADMVGPHSHSINTGYSGAPYAGYADIGGSGANFNVQLNTNNSTGAETRPKNVVAIYCQYSGTGNVAPATATVSGTANYVSKFTAATVLGNSQIFDNGTSVGIGTASPQSLAALGTKIVDLTGPNPVITLHNASDAFKETSIINHTTGTYFDSTGAATASNNAIYFRTNNTNSNNNSGLINAMTILSSGNVGIGTTSPAARFEIKAGSATYGGGLRLIASANSNTWEFVNSGGDLYLGYNSGGGNPEHIFKSNGTVGIGTTSPVSGSKLTIVGGGQNGGIAFVTGRVTWGMGNDGSSFTIGNAAGSYGTGVFIGNGGQSWNALSDRRLKSEIKTLSVLDKLKTYRAVSYIYNPSGHHELGVIAQELQPLFPDLVGKKGDYYSVSYDRLGAIALEGVKELKAENDSLRAVNDNQEVELQELRAEIKVLRASIH